MPPRAWWLALGLLAAGCASGPHPSPAPTAARRAECVIATDSAGPARPITAAFDDAMDAARARLAASRLAPVRLDCEDRALPGLASRWTRDTSARFWTLELPSPSGGASDTTLSWTAARLAATWRADPAADSVLRAAGVESVLPLDDRRLVVGFAAPHDELPPVLAERVLGVATESASSLRETEPGTGDLRDAVDRRTDLVQTGDPDVLDYAGRRADVTIAALPWSRLYLLVIPTTGGPLAAAIPADTAAFRSALAADAVRTDARPAVPSTWADSAARCRRPAAPAAVPADVIAYSADDLIARALAERLVALAAPAGLAVRPLEQDSLAAALRRGEARGYIVAGPRRAAAPCIESADWPDGASVLPLIEIRRHAIIRRGAPPLAVEWDGAVRLAGPGDTVGAAR
jgi:hypothetical protein